MLIWVHWRRREIHTPPRVKPRFHCQLTVHLLYRLYWAQSGRGCCEVHYDWDTTGSGV